MSSQTELTVGHAGVSCEAHVLKPHGVVVIPIETTWISKVHRIILGVSITIQRLRITKVVTPTIRIRLIESRVISIEAPEHGFIARVAITLITRVLMRLERSIA